MNNSIKLVLEIPFILAFVSLSLVVYGAHETAIAKGGAYQSGYNHGVADAKHGCPNGTCDWYILQPGKSFAFHSSEFNKGYVDGFCAAGGGDSDADEATWDCSN